MFEIEELCCDWLKYQYYAFIAMKEYCEEFVDWYFIELVNTFRELGKKFKKTHFTKNVWKKSKIRPQY